jgi:hypothetical protein
MTMLDDAQDLIAVGSQVERGVRHQNRAPCARPDRPTDAKRWEGCDFGALLSKDECAERLVRVYRRYSKQWNDIELDHNRSLAEHTHEICGVKVVSSSDKFILHGGKTREENWILEVVYARGFKQFYPGMSTGRNTMRSASDIKNVRLHWKLQGKDAFENWLAYEQTANPNQGEWQEYRA